MSIKEYQSLVDSIGNNPNYRRFFDIASKEASRRRRTKSTPFFRQNTYDACCAIYGDATEACFECYVHLRVQNLIQDFDSYRWKSQMWFRFSLISVPITTIGAAAIGYRLFGEIGFIMIPIGLALWTVVAISAKEQFQRIETLICLLGVTPGELDRAVRNGEYCRLQDLR